MEVHQRNPLKELPTDRRMAEKFDVDLNRSPIGELMELPFINYTKAEALVRHRPLNDWDELLHVPGLTPEIVDVLRNIGAHL